MRNDYKAYQDTRAALARIAILNSKCCSESQGGGGQTQEDAVIWKGEYSSSEQYAKNDLVIFDGDLYWTSSATIGISPPNSPWEKMVDGSSGEYVTELLIGTQNGSNAIFTSNESFIPESVTIYVNGVLQKIVDDYNLSGGNTVTFTFSPSSVEHLQITYIPI